MAVRLVDFGVSRAKILAAWVAGGSLAQAPAGALAGAPAAAETGAALSGVEPAEFGAGAEVTIRGSGFVEGDVVLLDSKALEDLKVSATEIRGRVPEGAKTGKKVVLKRAKKKIAELVGTGFVAAPKLTSASPKFAAPGEAVTLKGKNLDRVAALTLAGDKVKIDAQTATSITFTAPAGKTGPLAVKGVGGEAALKKEYEIFYAPALAKVEPAAAFEGDSVALTGEHLAAAKFSLGKKKLKATEQGEAAAAVTIAKGAKSGPLRAEARKKGSALEFTVHPTPLLTTVPKEVGAPGALKVSGKNLDAVVTWRLGAVALTPEAPASASKVTLTIPADAPSDVPLVAVVAGREFASKKPVGVLRTPVVEAMAWWPGSEGQGVEGELRGRDLAAATKYKLGGKALKVTPVDATRATFALKSAPKAEALELSAKTGKFEGPALAVDGSGGGYTFKSRAFEDPALADYSPTAVALDLEVSQRQPGRGAEALRGAGAAATAAEGQQEAAAIAGHIALDLRRFTLAQIAACKQMKPGKEVAASNAALGASLRTTRGRIEELAGQLRGLWSALPLGATDAGAQTGLAEADAEVAAVLAGRAEVAAACKGKFVANGKLTSDASQVAKVELAPLYDEAIKGAFAAALAKGKTWGAVEADVAARLAGFSPARRKAWTDVLKASKQAVEGGAAATTGKGARGDKHVEPKDKPKGGKGKGKG